MPIFLCYDSITQTSSYSIEKHNGMSNEFAKRRIKFFPISSPEELRAYLKKYNNEPSSIVFFPSNESERKRLFNRYSAFNIHKIVFSNANYQTATSDFSSVTSDFHGDMKLAISHLKEKGCQNIALFNVNPEGNHDKARIETYTQLIYHEPLTIYKSDSDFSAILKLFSIKDRIDAIICNNDYTAFRLMHILNAIDTNWNKKVLILSFSNTVLSSLYHTSLSSVSLNYIGAGEKIADIHTFFHKNEQVAFLHFVMNNYLFARESTHWNSPEGIVFSDHCHIVKEDLVDLIDIGFKCMPLEKLLLSSNISCLKIIHGLALSKTIEEMSNYLFLSIDSIRYHIKKCKTALDIPTTSELSSFLKMWIDPDKLKESIIKNGTFKSGRR